MQEHLPPQTKHQFKKLEPLYRIINYHAYIREREGYTKKQKDTRAINIREEVGHGLLEDASGN